MNDDIPNQSNEFQLIRKDDQEYYELPKDMQELLNFKDDLLENGATEREITLFILIEMLFKEVWDLKETK